MGDRLHALRRRADRRLAPAQLDVVRRRSVHPRSSASITTFGPPWQDPLFWSSLLRTLYFASVYVPLALGSALVLALFLNRKFRGVTVFRSLYFLQPLPGADRRGDRHLGMDSPSPGRPPELPARRSRHSWTRLAGHRRVGDPRLDSPEPLAHWAGGNTMLIFLAGLQGVPRELYEAATMDGANSWARFRYITIPMISSTIFFNLILGIIAALKVFAISLVATRGGPANATWFFSIHVYQGSHSSSSIWAMRLPSPGSSY